MLDKNKKGVLTIDDIPDMRGSKAAWQQYMEANKLTQLSKDDFVKGMPQVMAAARARSNRGNGGPSGSVAPQPGAPSPTDSANKGSGSGSTPANNSNQPQLTINLPWGQMNGQGNNPYGGWNNNGNFWGGGVTMNWGQPPQQQEQPKPADDDDKRPLVYRKGKLPKELPKEVPVTYGMDPEAPRVNLQKLFDGNDEAQIFLYDWRKAGGKDEDFFAMDRNKDGILTVDEVLWALKIKVVDPTVDTSSGQAGSSGQGNNGQNASGNFNRWNGNGGMPNSGGGNNPWWGGRGGRGSRGGNGGNPGDNNSRRRGPGGDRTNGQN
jgi:hypothetical protein